MKLKLAFFAAIGLMTTMGVAHADTETREKINPWQHCGIGAAIFDENETAAALSNVIWDSGTTAVSSATTSKDTCSSKEIHVAQFVNDTYDVLAMETASGAGSHLDAAMSLMGCSAEGSIKAAALMRKEFQATATMPNYPQLSHSEKAYLYYEGLNNSALAAGDCATT